ncbi:TetR/AcrR family transcriptional regulator [Cellulomonas hominis]|uniref:TetR/AcrR family transcriptional regulator n=2 Tax=Cellulomonas hominis TaxID=156981 RepID=A0A7Z8NQ96_9CELL|nr:TetR/AcrR family transcriptional regulator [Cellulomonas hominis]
MTDDPRRVARTTRARMTATQRRAQLLEVSRRLFAEKGFEGTSVEEIAARAEVSKPVVYEHFGGKEGIYAVVVDREIQALTSALSDALDEGGHPKVMVERSALALLGYIEDSEDGFRILVRDSPVAQATGTFSSLIGDVATQVEHLLAEQFTRQHLDPRTAPIYARMLVGMVALTGQHWLDARSPNKADVAAALVNLAWNGLSGLERRPQLSTAPEPRRRAAKPRAATDAAAPAGPGTPADG